MATMQDMDNELQILKDKIAALEKAQNLGDDIKIAIDEPAAAAPKGIASITGSCLPIGFFSYSVSALIVMMIDVTAINNDAGALFVFAASALFFGGIMETITMIFSIAQGDTLAGTVFGAYGAFFFGIGYIIVGAVSGFHPGLDVPGYMSAYSGWLALFGIMTYCFMIVSIRKRPAGLVVFFFCLATFFIFQAVSVFHGPWSAYIAGTFGLLSCIFGFYIATGVLLMTEGAVSSLPGFAPLMKP